MPAKTMSKLIPQITFETLGVPISPHMLRTCAITSAATYDSTQAHLGSALADHTDGRVTQEHYNRASSIHAAQKYGAMIRRRRKR
jgi:hypothetical protein